MLQYFVGKLFGDLPSNFNYIIGNKVEYNLKINNYEIYEGKSKNNEDVTIFIYEKKTNEINKYINKNFKYSKKLIHPNILKVLYTYENDKRIYIITEKCVCLLFEKIKTDPIWNIYEIINAVNFINSCNYVHCLISPFSIFLNSKKRWKLGIFDCIHEKNKNINNIVDDLRNHFLCNYGYELNFSYNVHSTCVDAYGICILLIWSYKNYLSSNKTDDSSALYIENENFNNEYNYKNVFNVDIIKDKNFIPKNLHIVYDILNKHSKEEINFNNILNDQNFKNNNIVKIMLFLSELHMKSKSDKNYFLTNLFNDINNICINVKLQLILPELIENIEITENVVLCLNIILNISKDLSTDQFQNIVYPIFLKYFSLTDRSIRFVILKNFHLIEKHLTNANVNELYNYYNYGLMDNNLSIKNESIKNFIYIFPKLKKSIHSSSLNILLDNLKHNDSYIKANVILCIANIAKYITQDKNNILENVFIVGLNDFNIECKLATLHSIKITYDQFAYKKLTQNILPQIVSILINDNVDVRINAFDLVENIIIFLKKELLNGVEIKNIENNNFVNEMNMKNDRSEIKNNENNIFIYENKNKTDINLLNDTIENINIDNEKYQMLNTKINIKNNNEKKKIQKEYDKEFDYDEFYSNIKNTNNKINKKYTSRENILNKSNIYNIDKKSDEHFKDINSNNINTLSNHRNEKNEKNLNKPNINILNTYDKKSKKIDIDIDEFFEEFNLQKETNKPKIKLTSLL